MVLEHDERLDSRQRVVGDPGSLTAHKTMSGSLLWWMTTASLVDAILDSAGPAAFALVIGPRTVVELRGDGTLRRARLRSFLQGGVGSVKVRRTEMDAPLEENFEHVDTLRSWDGTVMGTIGVDLGPPGRRWRFFEGNTYYLDLVIRTIAPTVIVDAAPGSIFGRYAPYEASRLVDGITLVVPHTHATEWYLRGLFDWVRNGRPSENPFGHGPWTHKVRSSWEEERGTTVAVTASAQFSVSGLFRDGQWREPENLEAARAFVQSRFDLRIGIWDLEKNPALRENLLKPTSVPEPPVKRASIPRGSARRATQRDVAKRADAGSRREAHVAAREQLEELSPLGWKLEVLRPNASEPFLREYFRLPLTQLVERYGTVDPLAWLDFELNPRSTSVGLFVLIYNQFDVGPYVASKWSALERIAEPGECDLSKQFRPILWRASGGWRDDVDWPERVAELRTKTPSWLEVFADLSQKLKAAWIRFEKTPTRPALKTPPSTS